MEPIRSGFARRQHQNNLHVQMNPVCQSTIFALGCCVFAHISWDTIPCSPEATRLLICIFLMLGHAQAHEEVAARGEGCAVLDGSLVERLHAENARRVIELHESIAALEADDDGEAADGNDSKDNQT